MFPRWSTPLLLMVLAGCSSATRTVRLDTGQGRPIVFTPLSEARPVALDDNELQETVSALAREVRLPTQPQEAARRLFEVEARSGSYKYEHRSRRITPHGSSQHLEEQPATEVELTRAYLRWCERSGRPGDCLRLLIEDPTIRGDGRFALALALARGTVLDEMLEAFRDMADPHTMLAAALWIWTTYMVLLAVPDVTVTKGLAAVMTATLIAYVGIDTFWSLVVGFKRLMEEANRAITFHELREAGERYGKLQGRSAARAFAMLALVAIGNTAPGLAAKVPKLPGAMQAAAQAETQVGIRLAAVGQVEAVTVSSGGNIAIVLSPGALAMMARGTSAVAPGPVDKEGPWHHIASNKFSTSTNNGGPWTPRYQEIFDRAGMSLDDPVNQVRVPAHKGPHPREYHEEVYERLDRATSVCRTIQQCQQALTVELKRLAQEISKPGSRLNNLVTRGE